MQYFNLGLPAVSHQDILTSVIIWNKRFLGCNRICTFLLTDLLIIIHTNFVSYLDEQDTNMEYPGRRLINVSIQRHVPRLRKCTISQNNIITNEFTTRTNTVSFGVKFE